MRYINKFPNVKAFNSSINPHDIFYLETLYLVYERPIIFASSIIFLFYYLY